MGEYKCSAKTRRKIYDIAQELLAEKGYGETSLIDIAKRAHVSTGTLYRHYPSKSSLLLCSADESVSGLEKAASELPASMGCRDRIVALFARGMENGMKLFAAIDGGGSANRSAELYLAYRSAVYASPESFARVSKNRAAMRSAFERVLKGGVESGEVVSGADTFAVADALVSVFFQHYDSALLGYDEEGDALSLERKAMAVLDPVLVCAQ